MKNFVRLINDKGVLRPKWGTRDYRDWVLYKTGELPTDFIIPSDEELKLRRKENNRRYKKTEKGKITNKKYKESEKGKETNKRCQKTELNKKRQRKYHLRRKFKLTEDEYNSILKLQDNVCAICKQPGNSKHQNGKIKRLAVDHCHQTGKVRGLLCDRCNRGIGFFQDNSDRLLQAASYIVLKGVI